MRISCELIWCAGPDLSVSDTITLTLVSHCVTKVIRLKFEFLPEFFIILDSKFTSTMVYPDLVSHKYGQKGLI